MLTSRLNAKQPALSLTASMTASLRTRAWQPVQIRTELQCPAKSQVTKRIRSDDQCKAGSTSQFPLSIPASGSLCRRARQIPACSVPVKRMRTCKHVPCIVANGDAIALLVDKSLTAHLGRTGASDLSGKARGSARRASLRRSSSQRSHCMSQEGCTPVRLQSHALTFPSLSSSADRQEPVELLRSQRRGAAAQHCPSETVKQCVVAPLPPLWSIRYSCFRAHLHVRPANLPY